MEIDIVLVNRPLCPRHDKMHNLYYESDLTIYFVILTNHLIDCLLVPIDIHHTPFTDPATPHINQDQRP